MIALGDYVACIVEGGAERAIIDILLDNNMLMCSMSRSIDAKCVKLKSVYLSL